MAFYYRGLSTAILSLWRDWQDVTVLTRKMSLSQFWDVRNGHIQYLLLFCATCSAGLLSYYVLYYTLSYTVLHAISCVKYSIVCYVICYVWCNTSRLGGFGWRRGWRHIELKRISCPWGWWNMLWTWCQVSNIMIEFFSRILEHFYPLFVQIAHMGLILPIWDLILPRIPPPTPVLHSDVTHPFSRYVRTQNTPKPTPKHPFSWPELESGQNELPSG